MATTVSRLFPTGVLQTSGELDEISIPILGGSVQVSEAPSKFLTVPTNSAFTLGTNNHTIEFWMYQTARGPYDTAFSYDGTAGQQAPNNYYLNVGSSQFYLNLGQIVNGQWSFNLNCGTAPSLNAWHHYAIVRIGNTFTVYLNGRSVGSATSTTSISAQGGAMIIGAYDTSGGSGCKGYITNFRFVNGVGVYTGNFPVPRAPFDINQSASGNIAAISGSETKLLLRHLTSGELLKDSSLNNFTVNNINGAPWSSLSPPFSKVQINLERYKSILFDEINLDISVAERRKLDGTYQVSGYFDDYTLTIVPPPIPLVSGGGQFNLQTAPTSGTTWTDVQGNYDATLHGSTTYVSNNGGGIRLNNDDLNGTGYISVPYNITSNTVTVEVVASFNPTSFWSSIWGNEIYDTNSGYLAYLNSSTEISYGIPNSETTESITASNDIRHWAFVIDGTQVSLFLNGSQIGTTDTIGNQTLFATNGLYFGARHGNNGTGFGDTINNSNSANYPVIYEMRLYNRALSASEVTQNYDSIKSRYGI